MNDQLIRDLLHEAADDIEPGDRLDAIRAATAPAGRRTHRGWWAAGGAGLLAASIATAFALTTGGTPQSGEPDVADPAPTSADGSVRVDPPPVSAIYYVGETSRGPRLFREFRQIDGDVLSNAVAAAAGLDPEGGVLTPQDPDYRSIWPSWVEVSATLDSDRRQIDISIDGAPSSDEMGTPEPTQTEAGLAVQALVRTAQGVVGERLPVQFMVLGQPADEVMGVSTSEPLTADSDASTLSPVSLSDPSEMQEVDNDDPFTVKGRGTSTDGRVRILVKRWEGTYVAVNAEPDVSSDRLSPFKVQLDLSDVSPGDYDVIATVINAAGTVDSDTRRITVVD